MQDSIFHNNYRFLLRKDEYFSVSYESNSQIYCDVLKESKRTLRKIGSLRITKEHEITQEKIWIEVIKALSKKKNPLFTKEILVTIFTNKSKAGNIDSPNLIIKGIKTGLLAEWIRYGKDGRVIKNIEYTIGPMGYRLIENYRLQETEQLENWKNEWFTALTKYMGADLNYAATILFELAVRQQQIIMDTHLSSYKLNKHMLYFQFIIHLLELQTQGKEEFDWKEIGAVGYQEIGGSKMYDSEKEWLLERLQEDTNVSLDQLGFISLGQIVSVYYSGSISLDETNRDSNTISALTDYEINNANIIHTSSNFIIITENRSPLVKMAIKGWTKSRNVLVICCDGQLRSAHKSLLQKIKNKDIPIYIWVDYDKSGLDIAKSLQNILGNPPDLKFVLSKSLTEPEKGGTINDLKDQIFQGRMIEQEQMLGSTIQWDSVFHN
ncbi:DUF2399 domain-containing protein [Paenibacillus oenotherae]|uniref:DUF2399 domain-containing protein n=1 Tax=Paenibacillus oenotherae TaxID=1435645 RepID=A0ABS7D8W6_9BACL|nr:DUF2399 domain-containing protein [Paenibacillus oenotherae]MBW7476291.1 DUF2399 domain-containing protein [Paenibacillus oenotherae]